MHRLALFQGWSTRLRIFTAAAPVLTDTGDIYFEWQNSFYLTECSEEPPAKRDLSQRCTFTTSAESSFDTDDFKRYAGIQVLHPDEVLAEAIHEVQAVA
jgi:hypothetical protein